MPIEAITRGLGIPTEVQDPLRVDETVESVYRLLQTARAKLLILRSPCALLLSVKRLHRAWIDPARCIGESCGCARFCNRTFSCGVCVQLCPRQAIELQDVA